MNNWFSLTVTLVVASYKVPVSDYQETSTKPSSKLISMTKKNQLYKTEAKSTVYSIVYTVNIKNI